MGKITGNKTHKILQFFVTIALIFICVKLNCSFDPAPVLRYRINILSEGGGTTDPSGIICKDSGTTVKISAIPTARNRLKKWTARCGDIPVIIDDSTSLTTFVVLNSGDIEISAIFESGKICTLSNALDTFNFKDHFFEYAADSGVNFVFASDYTRECTLFVIPSGELLKLKFYDKDSSYSISPKTYLINPFFEFPFTANVNWNNRNVHYYFKVKPEEEALSSDTFTTQIKYGPPKYSLLIDTSGNGTTDPPPGSIIEVDSGESLEVEAKPNSSNKLDHWDSTYVTIEETEPLVATVKALDKNAVLKAVFKPGEIYQLSDIEEPFNFSRDFYEINPESGVRLYYDPADIGFYSIYVNTLEDYYTKFIYYYDIDSTFTDSSNINSDSGNLILSFKVDTVKKHYFLIMTNADSTNRDFTAKIVMNKGLVAYYPFNGNTFDSSGNENHGEPYNVELCKDRDNNENSAYSFNGDSWIHIQNSNSLKIENFKSGYTISAWINNTDSLEEYEYIFEKASRFFYLFIQYGYRIKAKHKSDNSTLTLTDTTGFEIDKWFHIATTWSKDTSEWHIYKNGSLVASKVVAIFETSGSDGDVWIGASSIPNLPKFTGKIDDVYIFNRALTQDEIKDLYLGKR